MNQSVLLAASALCLALPHVASAGGTAPPPPPPPPGAVPCTANVCNITIKVTACSDAGITATPSIVYIPPGKKPKMQWTIVTSGYSFVNNGISWKTAGGNSEFPGQNPQPGSTVYTASNRHTKSQSHDYGIDLQDSKGNKCSKHPTVVNG